MSAESWKLSDATKAQILREYLAGEPLKQIAHRYGVDPSYPLLLAKRRGHGARRYRMAT